MTLKQEALFKAWIVAEGLATLMTPEELYVYNLNCISDTEKLLPRGLCRMFSLSDIDG